MIEFKYIIFITIFIAGCGHVLTHDELKSTLNSKVGKSYIASTAEKLINESGDYKEYEGRLRDGCGWILMINKKTNIVESWRYLTTEKPCDKSWYY